MPDFCTCGAQLPEDARFCHKCGKPQFEEEPVAEPILTDMPAVMMGPPVPPEISFHNVAAVRIGFFAALIASLLQQFPLALYIGIIWPLLWLVAAGFLAVYLYSRRTGFSVNVRGGARMGWITGVFCFVIQMVIFTISVILVSSSAGLTQFFKEQLTQRGGNDPNVKQVIEAMQSPSGLGVMLSMLMIAMFLIFTIMPTLGGALGAKVLDKH